MKWRWLLVCALAAAVAGQDERGQGADEDHREDDDDQLALRREESRNVHPRAYQQAQYNALPSGFRPSPPVGGGQGGPGGQGGASLAELAGYARPGPAHHRQQATRGGAGGGGGGGGAAVRGEEVREEEEEEREEPDRLAALLQQSRFDCGGKAGYYADQELACEVFHYCQDGVRHSWICPDGFTFHQVHLICMPPAQDNICAQSAKYHFVNEYLYRPLNTEENARKPSVPLRYSERYFPEEVYHDERRQRQEEDDEEEQEQRPRPARPSPAPPAHPPPAPLQVFRSAEEVDIPLLQRRPHRPADFRF